MMDLIDYFTDPNIDKIFVPVEFLDENSHS